MIGFAAAILLSGFLSSRSDDGNVRTATHETSVMKLPTRRLQRDLDRIAETADTSTYEGLHYVVTETVLTLLRHLDYRISGYSMVNVKRSVEDSEKRFNQLSIVERGKFDEETLVIVNSVKKQSTTSQRLKGFSNEYIVVSTGLQHPSICTRGGHIMYRFYLLYSDKQAYHDDNSLS